MNTTDPLIENITEQRAIDDIGWRRNPNPDDETDTATITIMLDEHTLVATITDPLDGTSTIRLPCKHARHFNSLLTAVTEQLADHGE